MFFFFFWSIRCYKRMMCLKLFSALAAAVRCFRRVLGLNKSSLLRWLKSFRTCVHLKDLLSAFPPGAPMLSTEEELQNLVGHRAHSVTMASIR